MSENPFATPVSAERVGFRWGVLWKLGGALIVALLLAAFLLPTTRRARPAARRIQCKNNLKQIGLAVYNYHDQYGSLPPAFTVDQNGQPLHSWRVLILPFLEEAELYRRIDLSKPWNHAVNAELADSMPQIYRCPSSKAAPTLTTYLGNAGRHGCFSETAGRTWDDITDGTSTTLLVAEVSASLAVPWMAPLDADADLLLSEMNSLNHSHEGGFQAALADGSVRFISDAFAEESLRGLMSIDGEESIPDF